MTRTQFIANLRANRNRSRKELTAPALAALLFVHGVFRLAGNPVESCLLRAAIGSVFVVVLVELAGAWAEWQMWLKYKDELTDK